MADKITLRRIAVFGAAMALSCCCNIGWAQTGVPFQIRVQQGNTTYLAANGTTINFHPGAIGKTATVTITLVYAGTTTAGVGAAQLFGPPGFSVSGAGSGSAPLKAGDSVSFTASYTANDSNQVTAQLNIPYVEGAANSQAPSAAGAVGLLLAGAAPNLVVTYALPTDGNVFTIDNGSSIPFPPTVVGTNLTATVGIVNRGSDTGNISKISISGDGFSTISLPLLPTGLSAGNNLQFGVRYAPSQPGNNSGTLTIVFDDRTVTISLAGTGIGSLLSYQLLDPQAVIKPNQTLNFPDTSVGDKSSLTIVVKNASVNQVTISTLAATGAGFSITDAPALPFNLNPNDTFVVTVTLAPTVPGPAMGRLRVANDTFTLSGNAIGPQLSFSYSTGSDTTTVAPTGIVLFSPIAVGQSEHVTFTIQNTGTRNATITSIGVTDPKAPFTATGFPGLPLSLTPSQTTQVTLTFSPVTTGLATAVLAVDAAQFTLSGIGTTPPPIPGYQFTGASGDQPALTQAGIGLTLSDTYPLELNGTLTIQVDSGDLPADPSVQFATGGKTVNFRIPAGTTQAVFPGGGSQVKLQTGSVAGTITITPSFALPSGLDLTPAATTSLSITVPRGPLQLQNAVVTQNSQNTLVLSVSGYSPTRTISSLTFQFSASANVPGAKVVVNLQSDAAAWFNSTQSQSFGGQFIVSVPFTITSSESSSTTTPTSLLKTVSIVGSDPLGTSNSITLQLNP